MRSALRITVVVLASSLLTVGCGGGGGSGGADGPAPRSDSATLAQVADCDQLADFLRRDARDKITVQADQLRTQGWTWAADHPAPVSTTAAMPTPQATAAPGTGANGDGHHFTDTNTQVPGIDEPDVVETDGRRLYVLGTDALLVLDATPPAATALRASIAVEGFPLGMFVAGNRALVLSSVFDTGELGGADACRSIGLPFPLPSFPGGVLPMSDIGIPTEPAQCPAPFVKVTLLDLTGTPPRTVREIYVEGSQVGARRQDGLVRVVAQRSWGLPGTVPDPWRAIWLPTPPADAAELVSRVDAWESAALAAVDASPLDAWLPAMRERRNGALVDLPIACDHAHVPSGTNAPEGANLVLGFDMSVDDSPVENTLLLGGAAQLYANGTTFVLAGNDWQAVSTDDSLDRTVLHVFDLPAGSLAPVYRGSGTVPGSLPSELGLDGNADALRVATTVTKPGGHPFLTVNRITTVRLADDGTLATVGTTPDIAPGERIFGVRFLGDRAYVVTFRQVDPLFVVDVADPAHPAVLGQVDLPGFSQYLPPLGDRHLLTVGQTADFTRPAVRIFDVGDPAHPALTSEFDLPTGFTTATGNHLAFVYDDTLGILALPFSRFSEPQSLRPRGGGASLFLLDVDADHGVTLRGEIRDDPAMRPCLSGEGPQCVEPCAPPFDWEGCLVPCGDCFDSVQMERGVFIDDTVYAISTAHVQAFDVGDLATPLATVPLP